MLECLWKLPASSRYTFFETTTLRPRHEFFFDWKNDRNQSHCGKWRDWNNNSIMKEYNTVNIEYHRHGDDCLPNLTLEEYNPKSIGKYGRMQNAT